MERRIKRKWRLLRAKGHKTQAHAIDYPHTTETQRKKRRKNRPKPEKRKEKRKHFFKAGGGGSQGFWKKYDLCQPKK